MTLQFPPSLLRERSTRWALTGNTITPGQTSAGAFPVARMDGGGLWVAELGNVVLSTADHIRTWRAIAAAADGGAEPIIVPSCDKLTFPAPLVDGEPVYSWGDIPHSDGTLFSDGSGYYLPVVEAEAASDATLRATTMDITMTVGGELRGGEVFSIEHPTMGWRRYEIASVDEDGDTITFRPPLREAVSAGTALEFDQPKCLMRLASGDAMALTLDMRRFGGPSATFVEWFF
jgi:hypothetical protein